jgi:hypothetical protein
VNKYDKFGRGLDAAVLGNQHYSTQQKLECFTILLDKGFNPFYKLVNGSYLFDDVLTDPELSTASLLQHPTLKSVYPRPKHAAPLLFHALKRRPVEKYAKVVETLLLEADVEDLRFVMDGQSTLTWLMYADASIWDLIESTPRLWPLFDICSPHTVRFCICLFV